LDRSGRIIKKNIHPWFFSLKRKTLLHFHILHSVYEAMSKINLKIAKSEHVRWFCLGWNYSKRFVFMVENLNQSDSCFITQSQPNILARPLTFKSVLNHQMGATFLDHGEKVHSTMQTQIWENGFLGFSRHPKLLFRNSYQKFEIHTKQFRKLLVGRSGGARHAE